MREIKFRAQREDNGEWVYGYYQYMSDNETEYWLINDALGDIYDVAPETAGQYTGLKDKNNKEIYEGDVVTSEEYPFQDEGEFNYHGIIKWDEELTSYYLVLRIVNPKKQGISDGVGEPLQDYLTADLEVIGNIHENPELLEVLHETL